MDETYRRNKYGPQIETRSSNSRDRSPNIEDEFESLYLGSSSHKYGPQVESRQMISEKQHNFNHENEFDARFSNNSPPKYGPQVKSRQYQTQTSTENVREQNSTLERDYLRTSPHKYESKVEANSPQEQDCRIPVYKYGPQVETRHKMHSNLENTRIPPNLDPSYLANKYGSRELESHEQETLRNTRKYSQDSSSLEFSHKFVRENLEISVSSKESFSRKERGVVSHPSLEHSQSVDFSDSQANSSSRQLIAHSARVQTPQRHHSESVLYIGEDRQDWKEQEKWNNDHNKLKLFPVNTYTVQPDADSQNSHR